MSSALRFMGSATLAGAGGGVGTGVLCTTSPAAIGLSQPEVWALRAPSPLFLWFCCLCVFPFATFSCAFAREILQCLGVVDTGTSVGL